MKSNEKWPAEKFLAYVLFYAAHADVHFKEEEKRHIQSKITAEVYQSTLDEFSKDNSYIQLQKILANYAIQNAFSPATVIHEMRQVCLSDNQFHQMERYMLSNVQRLFYEVLL